MLNIEKTEELPQVRRGGGRPSAERKQIQDALGGNVSMLIWLGKQMLEQKDKHEMSSDEEKGFVMHIKDYVDKNK